MGGTIKTILSVLLLLGGVLQANAQNIDLFTQHNGRYSFLMFGDTLNELGNNNQGSCDQFKNTGEADLMLAPDQTVVAAYLYWSGSGLQVDDQITLDGVRINADRRFTRTQNVGGQQVSFFGGQKDITAEVLAKGNGTYTFGDLDFQRNGMPFGCAVVYGGFAVLVVYEDPDLNLNTVNIYDGLQFVSQGQTIGIGLNNLNVIEQEDAELGFLCFEGDNNSGANETATINGNTLSNAINPANNAFNGTNSYTGNTNFYNMDLDFYDISSFLNIGDTQAQLSFSTNVDLVVFNAIAIVLNNEQPDAQIEVDDFSTACDNRELPLEFRVTNTTGNDTLPANTPIAFYADMVGGTLLGQAQTTRELIIGDSENLMITLTLPASVPQDFTLIASVNDDGTGNNVFNETNLNNNTDESSVHLLQSNSIVLDPVICDNEMHTLPDGSQVNTAATYVSMLINADGCDSTITTNLTVNPTYAITLDPEICDNELYTLPDGSETNTGGTTIFNLTSSLNCDSVVTVNLTINPTYAITLDPEICDNEMYTLPDGTMINTAGEYTVPFTTSSGCDSIYTVNLTVNPSYQDTVRIGICDGGDYTLPDGTVLNDPASGFYPVTLRSRDNCDSTVVTRIGKDSVYLFINTPEICDGDSFILEDGTSVTAANSYDVTFTSSRGCDSIFRTNLIVNPTYDDPSINVEICDNETFILPDGTEVSAAGDYATTLMTNKGCDSIVNTTITVRPTYETNITGDFCAGSEYVLADGSTVTESGEYQVILDTRFGCDSTFNYSLIALEVLFPTAFTPNANGENDLFKALPPVQCGPFITDFELRIRNRWGQEIAVTNDFFNGWDGTSEGELVMAGGYFWYARYKLMDRSVEKNGLVTLIR